MLGTQWPLKILLVHPKAPFFKTSRLTIAADCAVLSNPLFLNRFKSGETVVIGCPLLEDSDMLMKKLDLILSEAEADKIEVYTMEVPCCHAIHMMTTRASNKRSLNHYIVRVLGGAIEEYTPGLIDESMLEAERKAHGQIR